MTLDSIRNSCNVFSSFCLFVFLSGPEASAWLPNSKVAVVPEGYIPFPEGYLPVPEGYPPVPEGCLYKG